MQIRPDIGSVDQRKRLERNAKAGPEATPAKPQTSSIDRTTVSSYVQALAQEDPARLHRVEDLRQRLANGDYQATPEELVDPLLDAIERGL